MKKQHYSLGWIGMLCLGMVLSACTTVGPDYEPAAIPAKDVPQKWFNRSAIAHNGDIKQLINWWSSLNDPVLTELIGVAQTNSPTLARAQGRLQEAWATLARQEGMDNPKISANAQDTVSKGTNPVSNVRQESRGASLALGWEIDFFGSRARSIEAAQYRQEARLIDWHDARVTLASEVASNYINLRSCQAVAQIIENQLNSQESSARLIDIKVNAGFTGSMDTSLSQAVLFDTKNRLQQQQGQCLLFVNMLGLLTGLDRQELHQTLNVKTTAAYAKLPVPSLKNMSYLPAEVIARRPDVVSSERELAASRAEIGVALADRLPKISLSGLIGYAGLNLSGKSFSSQPWSIGPSLSWPLLDGGVATAVIDGAKARFATQYATYQQVARLAIHDVENALSRLNTAQDRMALIDKAAQQFEKAVTQQNVRYQAGFGTLLELEEVRRQSLAAQTNALAARQERLLAWIALYKAVGGDWLEHQQDQPTLPKATPSLLESLAKDIQDTIQ